MLWVAWGHAHLRCHATPSPSPTLRYEASKSHAENPMALMRKLCISITSGHGECELGQRQSGGAHRQGRTTSLSSTPHASPASPCIVDSDASSRACLEGRRSGGDVRMRGADEPHTVRHTLARLRREREATVAEVMARAIIHTWFYRDSLVGKDLFAEHQNMCVWRGAPGDPALPHDSAVQHVLRSA